MAHTLFGAFKESLADRSVHGGVDLDTDDIWILLLTSAGLTNALAAANTWEDRADLGGSDEVTGTGYTAGGVDMGAVTLTRSGAVITFDAPDTVFNGGGSGVSVTAHGAIIYKKSGSAATDLLICIIDFGGAQQVTLGTLLIEWDTDGIFTY